MTLFCEACGVNHEFTESEIERGIYAAIAFIHEPHRDTKDIQCFGQFVGDSMDVECLYEYAEAQVETRKFMEQ